MKKLLVIIGLVCWGKIFSQNDSIYNPKINQMSLQHFIETCFQEKYKSSLYNIGLSGICYAKFQITASGQLKDIRVSPGTNEILANFIMASLEKTNGFWNNPINGEDSNKEYIILPIEYNLQKDGKTSKSTIDPYALSAFFSPDSKSNSVKFIFLNRVEYTSPFDISGDSWKRISIRKQSL